MNVFKAIGIYQQERAHSEFIAFLLRPDAGHGLGGEMMRRLLDSALAGPRRNGAPPEAAREDAHQIVACLAAGAGTAGERERIDVLVERNQDRCWPPVGLIDDLVSGVGCRERRVGPGGPVLGNLLDTGQ